MELQPTEPPGSAQRKLRAFASELLRLRDEGYTSRVIWRTLAGIGIVVSLSTVQREMRRLKPLGLDRSASSDRQAAAVTPTPAASALALALAPVPAPAPALASAPAQAEDPGLPITQRRSRTRADVDEFFKKVNTNPLFNRKKEHPP